MDAVGIYLEGERLLAARIKRTKKGAVEIDLSENIKPEGNCKLVSGLDGEDLILRKLSLKLKSRRAILQTLPFQAEGLLPYPPEETLLLPSFSKGVEGTSDVLLSATTRTGLRNHLERLRALELDPDQVSSAPMAIFRFARHFFPDETDLFFLHIGEKEGLAGLILNKTLQQFYAFPLNDFSHLQKELERALAFLSKKSSQVPTKLLLTGNTDLAGKLDLSLSILEAPSSAFAIPLGLALEGVARDGKAQQFRQKEFLSERAQKRKTKLLSLYLLSCITLALVTWFSSHLLLGKERRGLTERLARILPSSELSLEEGLQRVETTLSKEKLPFALSSPLPTVRDLLAWLCSHPKFSQEIEIKEVRYQLVKYPKVNASSEPYAAKVELKFSASSPAAAKQVREALLKEDLLVNSKQEIGWNVQQNVYQTTFYLKPRP